MTNVPLWAAWRARPSCGELSIGIEDGFMLHDPDDWSLSFRSDEVHGALPADLRDRVTLETRASVMEIATGAHRRVGDAVTELASCATGWRAPWPEQGLRAAVAGTHPRRSGGAGPPALRRHGRRSSMRSRDPGCRAASAATPTGS